MIYPALGIMALIFFLKNRKLLKQLVLLLCTSIPLVIILIVQAKIMYPTGNTNESIAFEPFYIISIYYNAHHLPMFAAFLGVMFQSFLFPLAALPLLYKHLKETSVYLFVWISSIIAVSSYRSYCISRNRLEKTSWQLDMGCFGCNFSFIPCNS